MRQHNTSLELINNAFMASVGPTGVGKDIAIYNTFSIAQWIKGSSTASILSFSLQNDHNSDSLSLFVTTQNGGPLVIIITDKNGIEFYNVTYSADLSFDIWHHIVLTWNGFLNQFIVFIDGVSAPISSININSIPATLRGSFRKIKIGGESGSDNNRYYSSAIWDVALDGFDVNGLYNNGKAMKIDLSCNSGTYNKALNLRHWWRHGFEIGNIGKDFGFTYNLINIQENAFEIDKTNIINDFPGI